VCILKESQSGQREKSKYVCAGDGVCVWCVNVRRMCVCLQIFVVLLCVVVCMLYEVDSGFLATEVCYNKKYYSYCYYRDRARRERERKMFIFSTSIITHNPQSTIYNLCLIYESTYTYLTYLYIPPLPPRIQRPKQYTITTNKFVREREKIFFKNQTKAHLSKVCCEERKRESI
jgi:hypothetical protein